MSVTEPRPEFKNQRLLLRFAVGLLLLAALVFGFQLLRNFGQDPDILPADTKGMLAAIQYDGEGSKLVVFDADGKKVEVPGWTANKHDGAPVWRPDGQRLFFDSDREENTFHLFRYRPGSDKAERRSVGSRSKGTPWFGPLGFPGENDTAVITSAGFVSEYSPKDGSIRQLLPPTTGGNVQVGEESGSVDQFAAAYSRIGETFKTARWGKDRRFMIATMKREDGDVLMMQDFQPTAEGTLPPPYPIFAGESIAFDVAADGSVTASVQDFRWIDPEQIPEEFIKDGKATKPFLHGVIHFDPADLKTLKVLFTSPTNEQLLTSPVSSPDGAKIIYSVGKVGPSGEFEPTQLVVAPLGKPASEGTLLIAKGVFEPSWSPDGKNVIYARRDGPARPIFKLDVASGAETKLTHDEGEYGYPVLSPQTL